MRPEPVVKRACAFIDGQNLFHAAREAFGYRYPNYDPLHLAEAVSVGQGWRLVEVRFYVGVPNERYSPSWKHFWEAKLAALGTRGVHTFSRPLRYQDRLVLLPDGSVTVMPVGQEKGIDVRLALDVVRLARTGAYDVAVLFSQDQDLTEVADEVRAISVEQERWIKLASAFPVSPARRNRRGINRTDWIPVDRATYDACLDPLDYRPKRPGQDLRS